MNLSLRYNSILIVSEKAYKLKCYTDAFSVPLLLLSNFFLSDIYDKKPKIINEYPYTLK
jgi:hypothetical protein